MDKIQTLIDEVKALADSQIAEHHKRFFKTGKGEYAEGDLFYGITSPDLKKVIKKYSKDLSLNEIETLLQNPYHEVRSLALSIMVIRFSKNKNEQKPLYEMYLRNVNYINNWDLVDISAQYIIGPYVYPNTEKLFELAESGHLWSERIAMISSFYFIRQNNYAATSALSEYFLTHKHDLIHKASGWMLREVGKRDLKPLLGFLDKFAGIMPRTMLRYSIEKLDSEQRYFYMHKINFMIL